MATIPSKFSLMKSYLYRLVTLLLVSGALVSSCSRETSGDSDLFNLGTVNRAQLARAVGPDLQRWNSQTKQFEGVSTESVMESPYLVLFFTASWCPPCRAFTPELVSFLKEQPADRNYEIIMVGLDRNERAHNTYVENLNPGFVLVPYDRVRRVTDVGPLGTDLYLPGLRVIDPSGTIVLSNAPENPGGYRARDFLRLLPNLPKPG